MSLKENDIYYESSREANEEAAHELWRFVQLIIAKYELRQQQEHWWQQQDQDDQWIDENG